MSLEKWDLNYNSRYERFDHLYGKEAEAYEDVQSRYPMNIIELTGWNLEFYQYLKE